ncbi:MAG: histidine phosphatase family protein [Chloroflexaceae bacterium]|jgi:2,3-bisphosphoglycerate-dependent phosphoglycerate mutase|nr:histidine phosphatase family protein [Chloroflexaceae bacterium]
MIDITFLRHGHSQGDVDGVHEGRYDTALTPLGQGQATSRAQRWQQAGVRFDYIISSPLQRARTTAQIVADTLGCPLETDPLWMEMDNGPLAGLPFAVAEQQYPWPAFRHPYEPFFGTGESNWEIQCRAVRGVETVIRRGAGKYLVVSHGGILNAALRHIVGAPPPVQHQGLWFALGDTGFAHTLYDPSRHQWVLLGLEAGE